MNSRHIRKNSVVSEKWSGREEGRTELREPPNPPLITEKGNEQNTEKKKENAELAADSDDDVKQSSGRQDKISFYWTTT